MFQQSSSCYFSLHHPITQILVLKFQGLYKRKKSMKEKKIQTVEPKVKHSITDLYFHTAWAFFVRAFPISRRAYIFPCSAPDQRLDIGKTVFFWLLQKERKALSTMDPWLFFYNTSIAIPHCLKNALFMLRSERKSILIWIFINSYVDFLYCVLSCIIRIWNTQSIRFVIAFLIMCYNWK